MVKLVCILVLAIFLSSCEEVYHPAIKTAGGQLVVEALITNDSTQNFVHLTRTTGFYSVSTSQIVTGAVVKLVDTNGNMLQGVESTSGMFGFKKTPQVGQRYKLQILTQGDLYESETVAMPPIPVIDNFYSARVDKKEYVTNASGVPVATTVTGQELYLDAPLTAACSNYRFDFKAVVEWVYVVPNTPIPPTIFGWQTLYDNKTYNLAGQKKFSQSGRIEKQLLMMLPYDTYGLIQLGASVAGWIFTLRQYGTTQGSYDYHEMLNSQLTAQGSLFDPVQTQIYGNITCKTDSSKIAYGYFDLNSTRQYRYYVSFSTSDPTIGVTIREITNYQDIPDNGKLTNQHPGWWQ